MKFSFYAGLLMALWAADNNGAQAIQVQGPVYEMEYELAQTGKTAKTQGHQVPKHLTDTIHPHSKEELVKHTD